MKRIEIYINSKGILTIDLFKRYEDENVHSTYKGNAAYQLIRRLSSNKITDVVENRRRDNVSLDYKNYVVILNEPDILLKRKGIGPLIQNIKEYYEKNSKSVVRNKKVKRKNKHTGKKIIAAGLAAIMLTSIAYNIIKNEPTNDIGPDITIAQEIDNIDDDSVDMTIDYYEEEPKDYIFIDYGDQTDTTKAYITRAYYGDLIENYAKQYGLDPTLVLAIATQERGIHSQKMDSGGATGLMQIQNDVWENHYISAYNYSTQQYESIFVTNEKIKDINYNIKFACMYLQNCMDYMNYNTIAALQCYNMGYGNMLDVLKAYSKDTNKSIKDILADPKDTGWLEYRKIVNVGDPNYIENVFSWMGSKINLVNKKTSDTNVEVNVINQLETKKYIS